MPQLEPSLEVPDMTEVEEYFKMKIASYHLVLLLLLCRQGMVYQIRLYYMG